MTSKVSGVEAGMQETACYRSRHVCMYVCGYNRWHRASLLSLYLLVVMCLEQGSYKLELGYQEMF